MISDNKPITRISEQPNTRSHNSALKILVCYHKPYTMSPTDTDLHIQPDNQLNGQPCDNTKKPY
ncbi:MAG: hypothetical protein IJS39_10370 [Synergistaceae bacterium]|nr:hypothetical protein [Synergistaceae bacterium]